MPMEKMEANASRACDLLKSMANRSRLMILCQLAEKEMSVSELLERIPTSQSALSQHLGTLRREKVVKTRRDAQFIRYSLASGEARQVIRALYDIYCGPDSEDPCDP
ncbi:MAG: helix-turn-helix transcriptional regulator [Hyphomonadaceae bacterium]|nr:helix-turn-helix transcriptional regulator [Hyphomonadaceae bacterium]